MTRGDAVTTAETPPQEIAAVPAPPETPSITAPKPLAWPEWHGVVDLAAAVFLIIAGYLAVSFTASNSDVWQHFAVGRMLKEGTYQFGVDPFSFATEGRYWANHAWLWDRITYAMYTSDSTGATIINLKACFFAGAVILLLLIRKKGESLWPWVLGGGLAVMTSSLSATLRPFIVNPLFLMATMYVLHHLEWKAKSYRNSIILSILFAIWSNLDGCFILGPIAVGTVLLGEVIQTYFIQDGKEGLPLRSIMIAFVASTVACMVNPHHIHVWQWPAEFVVGLPEEMAYDREFRLLSISPAGQWFWGTIEDPVYGNQAGVGQNRNGLCTLILFLATIVSMLLVFRRVRIAHLLTFIVFTIIATRQISLLMPVSFVWAMLLAMHWNLKSGPLTLTHWGDPKSRLLFLGASLGRVVTVCVALFMVVAAWPGWLVPANYNRRASWAIEPEQDLVAAAKLIQEWRDSKALTADLRGITTTTDFANYLTWFAPSEKIFVNNRWSYHANDFPALLALRKQIMLNEDEPNLNVDQFQAILKSLNVQYVTAIGGRSRPDGRIRPDFERAYQLSLIKGNSIWHYCGRGYILGTVDRPQITFSPAKQLFGPGVQPLPEAITLPPVPQRESWADDFFIVPKPNSTSINEASAMSEYNSIDQNRILFQTLGWGGFISNGIAQNSESELITPILSMRAGRRAIAENPDDRRAFQMTISSYFNPLLPELFPYNPNQNEIGERGLQIMTLGRRLLSRLPAVENCGPNDAAIAHEICLRMLRVAELSGQRDIYFDLATKRVAYFKRGPGPMELNNQLGRAKSDEQRKAINDEFKKGLEGMEKVLDQFEKPVIDAKTRFKNATAQGNLPPEQKIDALMKLGLPGEVIAMLESAKENEVTLVQAMQTVNVMLNAGYLEKAEPLFRQIEKSMEDSDGLKKLDPQMVQFVKAQLPLLEYRIRIVEGNYQKATAILERMNANAFPPFSADEKKIVETMRGETIDAAFALGGGFPMIRQEVLVVGINQTYSQRLGFESQFAYQCALMAIFDGRPKDAQMRLNQAIAPQGETRLAFPWTANAKRFLKMIEANQK